MAYLATAIELAMPALILAGLMTRLATLPLIGMTLFIQSFVYPASWPDHLVWLTLLGFLLARGRARTRSTRCRRGSPTATARRYARAPDRQSAQGNRYAYRSARYDPLPRGGGGLGWGDGASARLNLRKREQPPPRPSPSLGRAIACERADERTRLANPFPPCGGRGNFWAPPHAIALPARGGGRLMCFAKCDSSRIASGLPSPPAAVTMKTD